MPNYIQKFRDRFDSFVARPAERSDGFMNALSGLGTIRDKARKFKHVKNRQYSYDELNDFYLDNAMPAKIIDRPCDDMTRRTINVVDPKFDDYHKFMIAMQFYLRTNLCLKWEDLFGGSGQVLGINDGREMDEPVDFNNVRGIDERVIVLDRNYLQPVNYRTHQETQQYRMVGSDNLIVHRDRILLQPGLSPTIKSRDLNQGWGESKLQRLWDPIKKLTTVHDNIESAIQDLYRTVYMLEGLTKQIALKGEQAEKEVKIRFNLIEMAASHLNAIVLDGNDKFDRKATPVQGLKEIVAIFREYLTSLVDLPHNILHGESPGASLGESGQGQMISYYDFIIQQQQLRMAPNINKLLKLKAAIKKEEPPAFVFRSLWEMDEKERAEIELKQAQRDEIYFGIGVLTSQSIIENRFSQGNTAGAMNTDSEARAIMDKVSGDHTGYDQ